jgi:hypothetical protein
MIENVMQADRRGSQSTSLHTQQGLSLTGRVELGFAKEVLLGEVG